MLRHSVWLWCLFLVFVTCGSGLCQGIPGCLPPFIPAPQSCAVSRPAPPPPITRTVQVDVPVPCAPSPCGPTNICAPSPCAPPVCQPPLCAPPQPTRPVQVRVDVVVRPEAPKPCVPQRFCCENPPVFEPFFCGAARLIQSLIVAPLGIGERLMGHPVPVPLPPATPIPCWRMCAPTSPVCVQPPPASQCMPPCPPAGCAPSGVPVKARQVCIPVSAPTYPPNRPFPR
jgi:hypothetical protein